MLSYSISYWDLTKIPYFADTTERGDKRVTLWRTPLDSLQDLPFFIMFSELILLLPTLLQYPTHCAPNLLFLLVLLIIMGALKKIYNQGATLIDPSQSFLNIGHSPKYKHTDAWLCCPLPHLYCIYMKVQILIFLKKLHKGTSPLQREKEHHETKGDPPRPRNQNTNPIV